MRDSPGTDAGPGVAPGSPGFDPERTTVHDLVRRDASAHDVLRRFGLDTCCGGDLPLAEAARLHEVELDRLLAALARAREHARPAERGPDAPR